MNTYTTKAIADSIKDSSTFQKYERKRPGKHSLDTHLDEHSERHIKPSCVKQAWRGIRENKRNWSTD